MEKDELAIQEADWYSPRTSVPGGHLLFTRKENMLIASAGVDKSNAAGYMIMWPKDLAVMVKEIHSFIKAKNKLKDLGIIISDSRVTMMRRGTIGIAIAHFG